MDVLILGTRGVPAQHGGFETFAEELSLHLVSKGHTVTVYCQSETPCGVTRDVWRGVNRVTLYGPPGPMGTISFDWRSSMHAVMQPGIVLTLGYNTAVFSSVYRMFRKPHIINMDGIEWQREKWSRSQRHWLQFNERAGARLADHLVADHPEIGKHLEKYVSPDKITVIPYGADAVKGADPSYVARLGLQPHAYSLVIARPEPENSILEIVKAYSAETRGMPLVILGRYQPDKIDYHRKVLEAASGEVHFPGAIYDKRLVAALRYFSRVYIHGHQVGGTNPSLVESLAAGTATLAHDNRFTRWVAGDGARYFSDADSLASILSEILQNDEALAELSESARRRFQADFTQETILSRYEDLLADFAPHATSRAKVLVKQTTTP